MKAKKISIISILLVAIMSFMTAICLTVNKSVYADTEFTSSNIVGVDATYNCVSATKGAIDSVIATEDIGSVRAGGNRFVIYQYDLISGTPEAVANDHGMSFGNTTQQYGIMYGHKSVYLYDENGDGTADDDMGNGLAYTTSTGGTPFIATANANKTITIVWDRKEMAMRLYVSNIGDEVSFSVTDTSVTVTGAMGEDVTFDGYVGYWTGNTHGTTAVGTVKTLSGWAGRCGLLLGNGTASLENIKAFDGNGNQLDLTFGNHFNVEYKDPGANVLTSASNTDMSLTAPINEVYRNPNAGGDETALYVNSSSIETPTYASSSILSSDDAMFTYFLPTEYGAELDTDGQALLLDFIAQNKYKAQIDFGKKIKLSEVESLTFKVWGSEFIYNGTDFGSGSILLFNKANERTVLGEDCLHLNKFAPSTYTQVGTDYVNVTVPASALTCLADENGYIDGVQLVRVNSAGQAYLVIDEISYQNKVATIDGLEMVAGASLRLGNPIGIGFITRIGYETYNELVETYGEENVKAGTIILPTDLLASYQFTIEALEANNVKFKNVENSGFMNAVAAESMGYYQFRGSLVNILEGNYGRAFTGRGYLAITDSGKTTYYYAEINDNSRSIRELATAAYKDVSDEMDGDYVNEITAEFDHYATGKYSPYTKELLAKLKGYLTYDELKEVWFTFGYNADLSDGSYENVTYSYEDGYYTLKEDTQERTYLFFSADLIKHLVDKGATSLQFYCAGINGAGHGITFQGKSFNVATGSSYGDMGAGNQSLTFVVENLADYVETGYCFRLSVIHNPNFGSAPTGCTLTITPLYE